MPPTETVDARVARSLKVPLRRTRDGLSGWSMKPLMPPFGVVVHGLRRYDWRAPVFATPSGTSSRSTYASMMTACCAGVAHFHAPDARVARAGCLRTRWRSGPAPARHRRPPCPSALWWGNITRRPGHVREGQTPERPSGIGGRGEVAPGRGQHNLQVLAPVLRRLAPSNSNHSSRKLWLWSSG